jgi:hypothetical protein
VFRERSRLPSQHQQQQQGQLAEKFLKAIENEREREREEEYREALRTMWNRYQDEESAIEQELFNDNENNNVESDYPINYEEINKKKKKRQVDQNHLDKGLTDFNLLFCSVEILRLLLSTGKTSAQCLYFHGYQLVVKSDFP